MVSTVTLRVFDLKLTLNIVFVAAACKYQQCWEAAHYGAATGWSGSDVCKDKCPSERWNTRTVFYSDSWGCRLNDDYEREAVMIEEFAACCNARGREYKYLHYQDC
jgi:hypothetical protein